MKLSTKANNLYLVIIFCINWVVNNIYTYHPVFSTLNSKRFSLLCFCPITENTESLFSDRIALIPSSRADCGYKLTCRKAIPTVGIVMKKRLRWVFYIGKKSNCIGVTNFSSEIIFNF